jgi:hypothetical protein
VQRLSSVVLDLIHLRFAAVGFVTPARQPRRSVRAELRLGRLDALNPPSRAASASALMRP